MACDVRLQALTVKLLHDDEGMPVVIFNAVDRANIGMVELRSRTGLSSEALQRFGIASQIFRDELQSDVPAQLQVFSLINHAHTTAPELSENTVMGYLLADHESTIP